VNLITMRNEVLSHGFDPIGFGSARVTQYLNDAYMKAVRKVDYYVDEATQDFNTVAGTSTYPLPANFARGRSLRITTLGMELLAVGLRDIDRSSVGATGQPAFYAFDGQNLHLYPAPDGVYPLEFRYWLLPNPLVNDTDTPTISDDYCDMLIFWALARCYGGEEDSQTQQFWEGRWTQRLSEFAADVKFPNDDASTQVASMWEGARRLSPGGWTIYGIDSGF
jgi:hypothetical protein